jgi:hypothetical protein
MLSPTVRPTLKPTLRPTLRPTMKQTKKPSSQPSMMPSSMVYPAETSAPTYPVQYSCGSYWNYLMTEDGLEAVPDRKCCNFVTRHGCQYKNRCCFDTTNNVCRTPNHLPECPEVDDESSCPNNCEWKEGKCRRLCVGDPRVIC